jgi:RimJ/RimL family protein N-acetyltransferase
VQVPAQPLLSSTALVDEIIAMVDQQLQLPQPRLLRPWRVEQRLAQRGSRDRERVDQVRLAPHPAASPLRRCQPWRDTNKPLSLLLQPSLQTTRHVPTVLQRPQPVPTNPLRPGDQLLQVTRLQRIELPADLIDSNSAEGVLVHVHPDHDHLRCLLPLGATGERTGLNRGKLPSSYQVTLDGLGKATATQHWQVSHQATFRNRVSRRLPESQPTTGRHRPRMTLSSGMTPEPRAHTPSVRNRRMNRASATDGRIVLRTERLLLTSLTRLDEAEHASASGRPADALRDTGAAEVQWRECGFGPWAIRDLREESFLGCAELRLAGDGIAGIEPDEVEAGWWVAEERRNQGIATEAMHAAIGDLWSRSETTCITAYIDEGENEASRRVAAKLGFAVRGQGRGRSGEPMTVYELRRDAWQPGG